MYNLYMGREVLPTAKKGHSMYQVTILLLGVMSFLTVQAAGPSEAASVAVRAIPAGIVMGYPQPVGA